MVVNGSPTVVGTDTILLDGSPIESWLGKASIPDVWFRFLQGRTPSPVERRMLEVVLVSLADHGETPPSTQAARLVASTGVPLQCSIAAGFLAFGDHHAGAIEGVMRFLQEEHPLMEPDEASCLIDRYLSEGRRIPGFGHRVHRRDPRVVPLVSMRLELGFSGRSVDLVLAMEKELALKKGIYLNVDGICGALLSDLGFPFQAGRAFFIAGRLPGILCHILREQFETKAFRPYRLVPLENDDSAVAKGEKVSTFCL